MSLTLNFVGFVPTDDQVKESWSAPGDPAALASQFAGWDPLVERSSRRGGRRGGRDLTSSPITRLMPPYVPGHAHRFGGLWLCCCFE